MPSIRKNPPKGSPAAKPKWPAPPPCSRPASAPLWSGPSSPDATGGITFSMLSRFLVCRERFRVKYVLGLRKEEGFNHRIEYGQMWHICEEEYAKEGLIMVPRTDMPTGYVNTRLRDYCRELCKKYPTQQDEVVKWYNVCRVQFPVYARFYEDRGDEAGIESVHQEKTFDVTYTLPSGRKVRLRGKRDRLYKVTKSLWVQENKSKGDVDEVSLRRQLTFDLQTMMYVVALLEEQKAGTGDIPRLPFAGVRYNVVRRPLAGGRGSIVQYKPSKSNPAGESATDFYRRLEKVIDGTGKDAPGPEFFFMRWETPLTKTDVAKFRSSTLDPVLEQLCDWWEWIKFCADEGRDPFDQRGYYHVHWRHPFGVWNVLDEGGHADEDEFLATGSEVGMRRSDELFEELK